MIEVYFAVGRTPDGRWQLLSWEKDYRSTVAAVTEDVELSPYDDTLGIYWTSIGGVILTLPAWNRKVGPYRTESLDWHSTHVLRAEPAFVALIESLITCYIFDHAPITDLYALTSAERGG